MLIIYWPKNAQTSDNNFGKPRSWKIFCYLSTEFCNLFVVVGQKQINHGLGEPEQILPNNLVLKSAHIFGILVFMTNRSNLFGCEFNDSFVVFDNANKTYIAKLSPDLSLLKINKYTRAQFELSGGRDLSHHRS